MAVENVIIIGSGPAGWTAAIYAARAELRPLVFEGAITEDNRISGTLPLGQLNLTTEVENFPGFPAGNLEGYLDKAIAPDVRGMMSPHTGHGVSGPELMELMRQQAKNFGTRIITDDIVRIDLSARPFRMTSSEGQEFAARSVIVATGLGPITWVCPASMPSRTGASAPARSVTEHCRDFATSRWW